MTPVSSTAMTGATEPLVVSQAFVKLAAAALAVSLWSSSHHCALAGSVARNSVSLGTAARCSCRSGMAWASRASARRRASQAVACLLFAGACTRHQPEPSGRSAASGRPVPASTRASSARCCASPRLASASLTISVVIAEAACAEAITGCTRVARPMADTATPATVAAATNWLRRNARVIGCDGRGGGVRAGRVFIEARR